MKTSELISTVSPVMLEAINTGDAGIIKLLIDGKVDRHSMDVALSLANYQLDKRAESIENQQKYPNKKMSYENAIKSDSLDYKRLSLIKEALVAAGAKPYRPKIKN